MEAHLSFSAQTRRSLNKLALNLCALAHCFPDAVIPVNDQQLTVTDRGFAEGPLFIELIGYYLKRTLLFFFQPEVFFLKLWTTRQKVSNKSLTSLKKFITQNKRRENKRHVCYKASQTGFSLISSFLPKLDFCPSSNGTFEDNLRGRPLQTLHQSFEQISLPLK